MPQIYQIHWYDDRSDYASDFMIYPLTGLPVAHAAALAREVKRDLESTPGMAGATLRLVGNDARGRLHSLAGCDARTEVIGRDGSLVDLTPSL